MFIFVLKKMTKLLVYTFIALIVLMAYIFYKNESVTSTAEPLQKAVEKAKTIVK
jgi:preprotein translocase subunit SecG